MFLCAIATMQEYAAITRVLPGYAQIIDAVFPPLSAPIVEVDVSRRPARVYFRLMV